MNPILILFVSFTVTFNVFALPQRGPDDMNEILAKLMNKCFEQTGIDPSTVTNEKLQSDDSAIKCFHGCMAKETKFMNSDGTVNKENLFSFPPDLPEDIKEHLKTKYTPCAELKGDNDCETGYLLYQCMSSRQKSDQ